MIDQAAGDIYSAAAVQRRNWNRRQPVETV
jgi:hypothetical protein